MSGPLSQGFSVALEAAKLALIDQYRAISSVHDGTDCDLRLVHIQADHALKDGGQEDEAENRNLHRNDCRIDLSGEKTLCLSSELVRRETGKE